MKSARDLLNGKVWLITKNGKRVGAIISIYAKSGAVTCDIQLYDQENKLYFYSTGRATGFGYDKHSAALYDALKKANQLVLIDKLYPGRGVEPDTFLDYNIESLI